jgi:uncharacterized Zn-binding protein involved in type VI secretion
MPGVARVSQDNAMGIIIGPGIPTVLVNGSPISVIGDQVTTHGPPPHVIPSIITGSSTVFAGGKAISLQGVSICSCAHNVVTGSPNVLAT